MYIKYICAYKSSKEPTQIKTAFNMKDKENLDLNNLDSALSHPHTTFKKCSNLIKIGYVKMASNLWKNETQL